MAAYDDRLRGFEFDVVRASVFFFIVHRDNDEVYRWTTRAYEAALRCAQVQTKSWRPKHDSYGSC